MPAKTEELQRWLVTDGEEFLRAVGLRPGCAVLDFGCRRGTYAIPAARLVGSRGVVHAVDKDRQALDELAQLATTEGLTNIHHIDTQGRVTVPLEDESIDVVLLYDVIHLMGWVNGEGESVRRSTAADRGPLVQEMHRVVRPGGLLSLYSPHLSTHTDLKSEAELWAEIEGYRFRFVNELYRELIHDDQLARGHIVNFARQP